MPPVKTRSSGRRWLRPTRALRVAGKVEPVFVESVADLAAAIVDNSASRGCGAVHGRRLHRQSVPAQVLQLLSR